MKQVRDQPDIIKNNMFAKFYPDVYLRIGEEMKTVGSKIDRNPPVE